VYILNKYILKYFLQPTDIFHYEHRKVCYDYLLLHLESNTSSKPWPTDHIQSFRLHLLEKIWSLTVTHKIICSLLGIFITAVSKLFWQRVRTITVGWFAGCMCKNHNTWYTYLHKLSNFYIIHICVFV
jgi:hypothetical protein